MTAVQQAALDAAQIVTEEIDGVKYKFAQVPVQDSQGVSGGWLRKVPKDEKGNPIPAAAVTDEQLKGVMSSLVADMAQVYDVADGAALKSKVAAEVAVAKTATATALSNVTIEVGKVLDAKLAVVVEHSVLDAEAVK